MTKVIFDRDGEGGKEAPVMGNRSINIWDGSEQKFVWSKKSSSHFENNFPILLLSGISNTSIFKVCDVLHLSKFLSNENLLQYFP